MTLPSSRPVSVGRLRFVEIRNYKSIGQSHVELGPLTILVGANGSGKSNFMDALAFVAECLSDSVDLAFKNRGGIAAARRRSQGHPHHMGMRLVIDLSDGSLADYSFTISAEKGERFSISRERCTVAPPFGEHHHFDVAHGRFTVEIPGIRASVAQDRLALYAASAVPEFRPLFNFLVGMRFYSIVPSRMRELQPPDSGDLLRPDGSNAAAVLKRLQDENPDRYRRVCSLLSAAVDGIESVAYKSVAQFETIEFRQRVEGASHPWRFEALNVSDGTLRMLGLLLAVYQSGDASVLGIEEPEATVHPAVAEQILHVLIDAARLRQIVVTTHSPDLLDFGAIQDDSLRVVSNPGGTTVIATLSETSRAAVRGKLYTSGELLREGELEGDTEAATRAAAQLNLFGPLAEIKTSA